MFQGKPAHPDLGPPNAMPPKLSKGGHGVEVPMTDELAKKMGFINVAALEEYNRRRSQANGWHEDTDKLLVDVCNLKQTVAKMGRVIMALQEKVDNPPPPIELARIG